MTKTPIFRRLLLKLSGETLMGEQGFGIDPQAALVVADYLRNIRQSGIELAVVIGGGNIFRGMNLSTMGMERSAADQMGMLATILNGIALQQALIQLDVPVSVMSAIECPKIVEPYQWRKAQEHLKEGKIVIFVGGTGNPYFTTDTAAALRASEIQANLLIKATKVDGIYTSDPLVNENAEKYNFLTYQEAREKKLKVMDEMAFSLCELNHIPLFVFKMTRLIHEPIEDILSNSEQGTWIKS